MRELMKGNEAVIHGALAAGCRAYFGYPITPASEIAESASVLLPQSGGVFVQAESEVGAIQMVYGASSAGMRCMTASSGPGISLMQEGISYLAGAELPCVIVDIMRGGPGLGNIGPEQSDYFQMVKGGGHGNYRNIVLAPNSAQEMCDITILAFDLLILLGQFCDVGFERLVLEVDGSDQVFPGFGVSGHGPRLHGRLHHFLRNLNSLHHLTQHTISQHHGLGTT